MKLIIDEDFKTFSNSCGHRYNLEGYNDEWEAVRFIMCDVSNVPCFDVENCPRVVGEDASGKK